MSSASVPPDALRRRCDPATLGFSTTADVAPLEGFLGQQRALEALSFGAAMDRQGYNLFVLGVPSTGRHRAVANYLERLVAGTAAPGDWIYVNDFQRPDQPRAIGLPVGRAEPLRRTVAEDLREIAEALPTLFDSDEYRGRQRVVDSAGEAEQTALLEAFAARAEARGVKLVRTPMGMMLAPAREGQVVKPEVFNTWPEAERAAAQTTLAEMQDDLRQTLEAQARLERGRRQKVRDLQRSFVRTTVTTLLAETRAAAADLPDVLSWLDAVRDDMARTLPDRLAVDPAAEGAASPDHRGAQDWLARYVVNVLVAGEASAVAPIVHEDNPTLPNLVGRVEHLPRMGMLVTDFSMIRAGALHRANGGFLLVDARKLLAQPYAWEALKRALRAGRIVIESPAEQFMPFTTVTLRPEPVPFRAKVVLFGEREIYQVLCRFDPDFAEVFKVVVDFDETMSRDAASIDAFARLVAAAVRREKLLPFDSAAVARMVEHAGRLAGDAERLSTRLGPVADLLREADYHARQAGAVVVGTGHVVAAEKARTRRLDRPRELSREAVTRGLRLVATAGATVGQVNGLSVMSLGTYAFGLPTRITARVRLGNGRLVDIERETEMGGPLHSKGVMILGGLLAGRYGPEWPLSLAATLVFEQSYGGVDGDSASIAELCALLSAIAELPLRQDLAVTGSLNQQGEAQPIGGVNEKIEGFFEVCAARGLTGTQGVIVPVSNVQHLMLDDEVVAAATAGRFHVHAVSHVDEALALLTGLPAGRREGDGAFTPGSVNRMVEDRLIALAKRRLAFGAAGQPSEQAD